MTKTIFDMPSDQSDAPDNTDNPNNLDNAEENDKTALFEGKTLNNSEWEKVKHADPTFYYSDEGQQLRQKHRQAMGLLFYSKEKPSKDKLTKVLKEVE